MNMKTDGTRRFRARRCVFPVRAHARARTRAHGCGRGRETAWVLRRDARLVPQTEDLELIYDPILNCYWDPTNNKYYELKND
jgi:hypothetical protein